MPLPPLQADRPRLPILPLLVFIVPIVVTAGGLKFLHSRNLKPIGAEIARIKKSSETATAENERLAGEVRRLSKEVAAMQGISKIEIVWGGASDDKAKIAFPYTRPPNSGAWVHPREGQATVWYYTDAGDTLARIASHPRVLGAAHLWPILARENAMKVTGAEKLPAGRLIRVPARIYEAQIRQAIIEAGAPDQQRNEIFAQAGLKP